MDSSSEQRGAIQQPTTAQGIGQWVMRACIAEVTAPKVGNVHLGASFVDAEPDPEPPPDGTLDDSDFVDFTELSWKHFVLSASVVRPVFDQAERLGVGKTVLQAVEVTRETVGTNTNLGMILLLAPLAVAYGKASSDQAWHAMMPGERVEQLRDELNQTLASLRSPDAMADAENVYEAIRLAHAGGLGTVEQADVHDPPSMNVIDAMALASDRDLVARQFVDGFSTVFDEVLGDLCRAGTKGLALDQAIVWAHLKLMAGNPDSLIARKWGLAEAQDASGRARHVLDVDWPNTQASLAAFSELDFWLREPCHRRNPGTSADLVTAGLFVGMVTGVLLWPPQWETSLDDGSLGPEPELNPEPDQGLEDVVIEPDGSPTT